MKGFCLLECCVLIFISDRLLRHWREEWDGMVRGVVVGGQVSLAGQRGNLISIVGPHGCKTVEKI